MKTPSPRFESRVRRLRWLAPAALLALIPKCPMCLLAYAGLASALGLGSRDLCCGPAGPSHPWLTSFALLALALGSVAFLASRQYRRAHSP